MESVVSIQPEFAAKQPINLVMDLIFQAMSAMMIQVNHTNQTLLTWLTSHLTSATCTNDKQKDAQVHPISFFGLPIEDILASLDHFDYVARYHVWEFKTVSAETRTLSMLRRSQISKVTQDQRNRVRERERQRGIQYKTVLFKVRVTTNVGEHMLYCIPIRSSGIVHKYVDDSYNVSNVRSCRDHHIH